MTTKLTKKGARQVSKTLDRVATLFQEEHETLGLDPKIANDFAQRCDLLSDFVEKKAGFSARKALTELDVVKESGFNPEEIGMEKSGPLEMIDSDEPYMNGQFTQQENRELRYDQEDGKIGPDKTVMEPQSIPAGKQAGFDKMGRRAVVAKLSQMEGTLHSAALKLAGLNQNILASGVLKLAQAVMDTQMGIIAGTITAEHSDEIMTAMGRVIPHIATVSPQTQSKVAQMIDLALHIAKKSDDGEDKDDKKDDKKDDSGKSFFEKMEEAKAKKKAKKADDDEDEDDDDDEEDDNEDDDEGEGEVEGKKKASHGFNLNA